MAIKLSTGARTSLLGTSDFQGTFNLCFIDVYSGSQPSSADAAPTGTKLMTYSVNHDDVTGGTWAAASAGAINKNSSEVWQAVGSVAGSAGYFRMRLAADTGVLSTTEIRMDGSIASSGSDMNMTDTAVTVGAIYTLDSFPVTMASNA